MFGHACTRFRVRSLMGCVENGQGGAMAVRFTVGDVEKWGGCRAVGHHEESKKAGDSVRTAIISPDLQTGQVGCAVESAAGGSDRFGVTWRS